eukprot:Gb_01072 [translate_table: standard]
MVGADICGFEWDTTEDLCNRWIQLGSFYPFSRNHSNKTTIRQELYLWKSVAEPARKALGLRYHLLPHIYTLSFEAHSKGFPIERPLFFTFQEDPYTLEISSQFLLRKGILVSPVLKQGATTAYAYFPKGTWQEGGMTTRDARRSPFNLLVALGGKMEENGELFLDNGESVEMRIERGKSTYVEFYANVVGNGVSLRSQVQMGEYAIREGGILNKIIVLAFNSSSVDVGFMDSDIEEGREIKLEIILNGKFPEVSSSSSYVKNIITRSAFGIDDQKRLDIVLEIIDLSLPIGKNFDLIIPWKK